MPTTIINNELKCSFADSFHIMDTDEIKHFFSTAENRWAVYDKDKHIIISVSWTRESPLNLMLSANDILRGAEEPMKNSLKEYRNTGHTETTVMRYKAKGFRFEYKALDTDTVQSAEMLAFRLGTKFYVINCICRKEDTASCLDIFEGFLAELDTAKS